MSLTTSRAHVSIKRISRPLEEQPWPTITRRIGCDHRVHRTITRKVEVEGPQDRWRNRSTTFNLASKKGSKHSPEVQNGPGLRTLGVFNWYTSMKMRLQTLARNGDLCCCLLQHKKGGSSPHTPLRPCSVLRTQAKYFDNQPRCRKTLLTIQPTIPRSSRAVSTTT